MCTGAHLHAQGLEKVRIGLPQTRFECPGLSPQRLQITAPLGVALVQVQKLIDLLYAIENIGSIGEMSCAEQLGVAFKCRQPRFQDIRAMMVMLRYRTICSGAGRTLMQSS
jgi:hypothetical protein